MSSGEGEDEVDFCFKLCSKDELASVWPGKCVYVVEEIIHTEQVYVTDLENIVKGYKEPFSHHSCVKNSGIDDLSDTIFGNVVDLLYLHRSLLKDMTTYSKQPADYGDVFLQHENEFNHYKVYCKNFPKAIQLVQDCMDNHVEVATVFKQCQHKMNHALPLPSLLIKPVQRILKYHLLLANITKHLTPNFQGFTNLSKAHSLMLKVAADINETQRLYEASIRMEEIENCLIGWKGQKLNTYGNVLLEDYLKVIGFKGLRYVIVFEKLLLLLKKDRKDNVKYHYKGHIEGDEVSVMATPIRNHPYCFKVFSIVNRDHYYLLETKNEDEKMKWMATLVSLIETDLSMTPNDILTRTSALPPTIELPDPDAVGSRKRHRSSQEDEGVPELKQREALSDQSNFAEDIGPAPAVVKRHYAVRRKTSLQLQTNDDDQQSGTVDKPHISDVIPEEASTNAKLLEYTTLDDENAQVTPLAELSEHDRMQWSDSTKDDEHSFLRAQSVSLGVEHHKQEQEQKESHGDPLLKQHETFNSLDLDNESKFRSSMHRWDDVANLTKLKDDGSGYTADAELAGTTEAYRESVVSASSLESFTIDAHGNLDRQFSDYDKTRSASSSNRSSCVDIDDIFINTDPSMSPIPEEIDGPPTDEVDGVHEETKGADKSNDGASQDHMIQSMGEDEVDFHDENPPVPSLSFDTVHSEGSSPVKSQSSDTDSEEEHDIDPSAHDSPMYTSITSSLGKKDDTDPSHVSEEDNEMFVTASGRFIAPTSTLPRMRRSMTIVGNSPYSLDSTPDSPSVSALARKRFHLVAKSFELYKDDEMQDYSLDDGAVMLSQEVLTTSSLPAMALKRSQSVRGRSQSVIKKSPRKPLKRSSLVDSHSEPNSISSPPISFKTEEQNSSFAVKNLAPVFEEIRSNNRSTASDSNTEPASAVNVPKQSSDATQFTCSMDTTDNSNVDNAPLSPPKPFQFTASPEVHSLPTGTIETSTTITPVQGLITKTSSKDDDDEFSTPENQIGVPVIQPLSHSPHVPGKTPHGTSTVTKSKLFTSTTASVTADSPSDYTSATKGSSTLSESADSNTFTTPDVANKSTDSTTGQQDVEHSVEHSSKQISSDGKDDVKDINPAAYVQLNAANLTKEHSDSEVPSSVVPPSLLTPATTEEITSTVLDTVSHDSKSSSFDSLSPLVLSQNSVLQEVVNSDKSAQFPVTPDPLPSHKGPDQIPQATVSPSKSPKDYTHLQAPTEKKHSRRKHPNDPYALSPQAGRLVRSLEYTDNTHSIEGQAQKSPTAISPSSKYSRSLGDVATPKLKSMSTPSTPATDVSFELPPENVVLQGRVSSFSMNDSNNPILESHITIDDVNEVVDEEEEREYGETSPLIDGRRHSSQPKTRNRQKPQHKVASGRSYQSIEEAQPLLAEDSDEDTATPKAASTSWFSNFSVRSMVGYLINLGSGIGNLLYYYISEMFRARPVPNNNNNHIN